MPQSHNMPQRAVLTGAQQHAVNSSIVRTSSDRAARGSPLLRSIAKQKEQGRRGAVTDSSVPLLPQLFSPHAGRRGRHAMPVPPPPRRRDAGPSPRDIFRKGPVVLIDNVPKLRSRPEHGVMNGVPVVLRSSTSAKKRGQSLSARGEHVRRGRSKMAETQWSGYSTAPEPPPPLEEEQQREGTDEARRIAQLQEQVQTLHTTMQDMQVRADAVAYNHATTIKALEEKMAAAAEEAAEQLHAKEEQLRLTAEELQRTQAVVAYLREGGAKQGGKSKLAVQARGAGRTASGLSAKPAPSAPAQQREPEDADADGGGGGGGETAAELPPCPLCGPGSGCGKGCVGRSMPAEFINR